LKVNQKKKKISYNSLGAYPEEEEEDKEEDKGSKL
jgi:hypothetical protein